MRITDTALTSRETNPEITRSGLEADYVISDAHARTIAQWWQSPAAVDVPITALSSGVEFDPDELYQRVVRVMREAARIAPAEDLDALRKWVLAHVRHVVVTVWELTGDKWQAYQDAYVEGAAEMPARPDGSAEVFTVAESAGSVGDWVHPGDAAYPSDVAGHDVDPGDNSIWLGGGVTDTTLAMLAGTGTDFYAQSNGGDPFDHGPYWWQTDPAEGGNVFADQYIHPQTGEVTIKTATLVGFSNAEVSVIRETWHKRA